MSVERSDRYPVPVPFRRIMSIDRFIDLSQGLLRRSAQKLQRYRASMESGGDSPLFVLSTGRVGSKTLAAMFGLSRELVAEHEPAPKLFGLSRLAYEMVGDKTAERCLREAFAAAREEQLASARSRGAAYVETSPQVTFLAPFIHQLLPNAKFLHIARHPAHVVRSGMRRLWYSGNRADKSRIVPRKGAAAFEAWPQYGAFQKNVWLWTETNRWVLEFLEDVSAERKITVRAEDVFFGDETVIAELFTFAGVNVPKRGAIRKVLAKRMNEQKAGEFPTPAEWTTTMWEELAAVAGPVMKMLGYASPEVSSAIQVSIPASMRSGADLNG